jgi:lipopolysaccharide/colanic/teichoic acid biosynthesis glycosyltransferase
MYRAHGDSLIMKASSNNIFDTVRSALLLGIEGIHSEAFFRGILKRERAVAERNSHHVTVLAFYSHGDRIRLKAARILGGVFADRLRVTDLIGWMDIRTIGVILPHTCVKDASLLAEQICSKMASRGVTLDYKFYLYPHDECGKWDKQRELPLPHDCDCSPAANAGHELHQFIVAESRIAGEVNAGDCKRASAHSLDDICSAPVPVWKRGLDIALCLFGLTVFGPLMLLIAIGIKIVAPGPVLFRQERIGYKGKPFMLFKFRSMKLNADTGVHKEHLAQLMKSNACLMKLDKADARLIPFGKLFRASGLDELPQLFNILRGDMSFIGPRPCVPYEYEQFSQWHKRRCETYPGLTGLWQVSGKNKTTFTEMMRLDIKYGHRQSLREEMRILLQTIPAVLGQIKESSSTKGST